jgi:hypothetical protein
MGVLYAEKDLLADAEREFGKLLDANHKSSIAQKLLNDVRAALRRHHPPLTKRKGTTSP